MLVFVRLLFEGGVYFFADQVRTSDTVMIARYGQHTRSLPVLLPTVKTSRSTQIIRIRVRVRRLFCAEFPIVRLLFESDVQRATSI